MKKNIMNRGEKIRMKKSGVSFIFLTQNKLKFKQIYCFNLLYWSHSTTEYLVSQVVIGPSVFWRVLLKAPRECSCRQTSL